VSTVAPIRRHDAFELEAEDRRWMQRALELAEQARIVAPPNPWVGCVVVGGEQVFEGATSPPGGSHAEAVALAAAGPAARGATLYVTLEPCAHHGRTPPCADAIVAAGVARVVVGLEDPDARVRGRGIDRLRQAGIEVQVGTLAEAVAEQLAPYCKHRRTGRPYVVLKLAATLDGRIAAPDGSSRWITGPEARRDAHLLRAASQAVLVGAGTVRADDPELSARLEPAAPRQPRRVVLGEVPAGARVLPALVHEGELEPLLDRLGAEGVLQLLVEGGAHVAGAFHRGGLVDRYVIYFAPALFGGEDAVPMFRGEGVATIAALWRGRIASVAWLGRDLRVDLVPSKLEASADGMVVHDAPFDGLSAASSDPEAVGTSSAASAAGSAAGQVPGSDRAAPAAGRGG
jgi:diaminohydroxyphosphoribosylaminopyrimidine deaminase/5-amino-6-(5-phosphoribosylamino)uracil reductase